MYRNVILEKGLYNLTGKSFVQALEELDPSENYTDTALAGLDAYERQLKRFDIKVNGKNCDKVEKFFSTTQSAVLFPEFVSRTIKQGMADSILEKIVAVKTSSASRLYRGFAVSDNSTDYDTVTTQGNPLPVTSVTEDTNTITLDKLGRVISTSYEAVMNQAIDAYALTLRSVGKKLANAIVGKAVDVLITDTDSISIKGSALTYSDITALYGSFKDFNMDTILVSPSAAAEILSFAAMEDCSFDTDKTVRFPFGTAMISSSQVDDNKIIGLDSEYALEMISASDIILETDRIIDKQLDYISVSVCTGFKKLMADAVKVLTIS
ncbi:MAG: hypothetical protein ACI4JM_04045 [Oscillospiraceae bacterium]